MKALLTSLVLLFLATSFASASDHTASAEKPPAEVEAWLAQEYGKQMEQREGVPFAGFKLLPKGETNPCPPGWKAKIVALGEEGAAPKGGTFGTVNCRNPNGFVPKVGMELN